MAEDYRNKTYIICYYMVDDCDDDTILYYIYFTECNTYFSILNLGSIYPCFSVFYFELLLMISTS